MEELTTVTATIKDKGNDGGNNNNNNNNHCYISRCLGCSLLLGKGKSMDRDQERSPLAVAGKVRGASERKLFSGAAC